MTEVTQYSIDTNRPAFGFGVAYPAVGIIERVGPDWDWLWIDGQHGELSHTDIMAMIRGCELIGRPAFVRVAGQDPSAISQVLDAGASAVIVPQVESMEEALRLTGCAKFPPVGKRSYGGRRIIDRKGRGYNCDANRSQQLILQVESPHAVEQAEILAAIDGVDGLFMGPDDYLLCLGQDMEKPASIEDLKAAMQTVAHACRKHGKTSVMVGINTEILQQCFELGFDYIVGGTDSRFLAEASLKHSKAMRLHAAEFSAQALGVH